MGYTDIGPVVGLGGIGGASASFGGRFEHAIKPLPDLGNGMLGIQAAFDYYSWSTDFTGYSWSYKYIPIGVTANYHFKLDEPKIDPFVGAGPRLQHRQLQRHRRVRERLLRLQQRHLLHRPRRRALLLRAEDGRSTLTPAPAVRRSTSA